MMPVHPASFAKENCNFL